MEVTDDVFEEGSEAQPEPEAKRPPCPSCSGTLVSEWDINDRVVSVHCLNCGDRWWRDLRLRRPTTDELNGGLKGKTVYPGSRKPRSTERRAA